MNANGTKNILHKIPWLNGIELFDANQTQHSYVRHAHAGFAIGTIRQGVGGNWYRGASHTLPPQTLNLMNPEEAHTGYELTNGLRYSMIYVTEDAVQDLLGIRKLRGFKELNAPDPELKLFTEIVALTDALGSDETSPARRMLIEECVHTVLGLVFMRYGDQSTRPAGEEPVAVRRAKALIEAHVVNQPDQDITITDIAREVGLRPNYLIQSFSRSIGVSPHAYLMQRKICRAKEMLGQGHRAIDVATALGFYDQPHFIRHFRKVTGVTPGAMRVHP